MVFLYDYSYSPLRFLYAFVDLTRKLRARLAFQDVASAVKYAKEHFSVKTNAQVSRQSKRFYYNYFIVLYNVSECLK